MKILRPHPGGLFQRVLADGTWLGNVALGNGTQYRVLVHKTRAGVFAAVESRGAYEFNGYTNWAYLQVKLDIKYESDARNLADFINDQLGWVGAERQGDYRLQFCEKS